MHTIAIMLISGFIGILIGWLIAVSMSPMITPLPVSRFLRVLFGIPSFKPPTNWNSIDDTVSTITGIEYSESNPPLTFDIHWPAGTAVNAHKCILWIHGGGFVGGGRASTTGFCMMLANRGCTVVNMDYRLAPRHRHPAQIIDVDKAIRALYSLPANLRPDMNWLYIGGDSAGAHIASEYAALITNNEYRKELNILLPTSKDTEKNAYNVCIRGCILICGLYDFKALMHSSWWRWPVRFFTKQLGWAVTGNRRWYEDENINRMDVCSHITSSYPPCFITDGNYYTFNNQLPVMDRILEEHAVSHVIMDFPRKKHGRLLHEFQFDMTKKESLHILDGIESFINASED